MQTVLICGGQTDDRRSFLTGNIPATWKILDKTLMEQFISGLERSGVTSVTLAVPQRSGGILSRLEQLPTTMDVKVITCRETDPLSVMRKTWNGGEMLCIICDHMDLIDYGELIRFHKKKGSAFTPAVRKSPKPWEGCAVCMEQNGRIKRIQPCAAPENCRAEYEFCNAWAVSPEIVAKLPPDGKMPADTAEEYFSRLCKEEENLFFGYEEKGVYFPLRTPSDLTACCLGLLEDDQAMETLGIPQISSGIFGESTSGLRGVSLIPPVYIGRNVSVGKGSVLGGGAVLCDNVSVGENCRIENSYIGEEAAAADEVRLNGAAVCRGARLKKGCEMRKGSAAGARSCIGENTCVCEGVRVGEGKTAAAGLELVRDVSDIQQSAAQFDDDGAVCDISGFFTPSAAASLGMAAGTAMAKGGLAVVGYSGEKAAKPLADSFCAGLSAAGARVWQIGEALRSQTVFAMGKGEAELGVQVTAGISVRIEMFDKGGLKLTSVKEREIERRYSGGEFRHAAPGGYGEVCRMEGLRELYERRLAGMLPDKLRGIRVAVRTSDRLAAQAADRLFLPRNDLAGEEVIFHLNTESGGLTAYSEKSGYVFSEKLIIAAQKENFENGAVAAVPYTFPDAIDAVAQSFGGKVARYLHSSEDGSDSVGREAAAGEENLFVRDPLELAVRISAMLSRERKPLFKLVRELPDFYAARRFVAAGVPTRDILNGLDCAGASCEGEVCAEGGSRAVVRGIRNGGGLMIFAQAHKAETASALCDEIEQKIRLLSSKGASGAAPSAQP